MLKPGVYPASVTPLDEQGRVDPTGVAKLLAWFRSSECTGIVMAGTNGEGPSLSAYEKRDLFRTTVELSEGMPVIVGIATSSLDEAAWLLNEAAKSGAAAGLVMPPMYFRETPEEGVAQWFEALFERSRLPILTYNFPQRTGFTFRPELLQRLEKHERMIGLKDSSCEPANIAAFAGACPDKLKFVGDETLLGPALEHGWSGTISGSANVLPGWLSQAVADYSERPESCLAKLELIDPALKVLRGSPQPWTNKEVLVRLGVLARSTVKLPLLPGGMEAFEASLAKLVPFLKLK